LFDGVCKIFLYQRIFAFGPLPRIITHHHQAGRTMPKQAKATAPRLGWGVDALKAEIDKVSQKPVPKNWCYEAIKSGLLEPAVRKTGHRTIIFDIDALHQRLKQIFSPSGDCDAGRMQDVEARVRLA
jgi:hypothetical protein